MRNPIRLFIVTTIVLGITYLGCRKTEVIIQEKPIEEKTINLVKEWLSIEKSKAKENEKAGIDSILLGCKWAHSYKYTVDDQQSILYIPINSNQTNGVSLTIFINEQLNSIDSGNLTVVKLKDLQSNSIKKGDVITNLYRQLKAQDIKSVKFQGSISNYSISNKFKYEYGVKNDLITYAKFILPSPSSNKSIGSIRTSATVCYHYYWVTNNWETGIQHWEYLFSNCFEDGGCPTTTSIRLATGEQFQKNSCGGGDPNGGTPGPEQEPGCSMSQNDASEVMSNIVVEFSTSETGSYGAEETLSTGRIERPSIRTVNFIELSFPFPFVNKVKYGATYTGKQFKDSIPDVNWKWDNLSYSTYGQSSGTIPPCFGIQMTVTASNPVISSDKRTATAIISCNGQYKLSCAFGWQIAPFSGTTISTLNAVAQF